MTGQGQGSDAISASLSVALQENSS